MKLESSSSFDSIPFAARLSQEERNFFEALRFTSWTDKPLMPGQRRVAIIKPRAKFQNELSSYFTEDALHLFDHDINILKRVFEVDGRKILRVILIQEKKPEQGLAKTIENTYAGAWHHHRQGAVGEGKSTIVVLADKGGTDFADGHLDVDEKKTDIHDQAVEALRGGSLVRKKLPSGTPGHFNKNTIHRRANFEEEDPRVVLLVEYAD